MTLVFDVEANGFRDEATKMWCCVAKSLDEGRVHEIAHPEINNPWLWNIYFKELFQEEELIGHNIINYDLPLIEKLTGLKYGGKVTDTLVMSRLLNPDRERPFRMKGRAGPHSVEAWAIRLGGEEKVEQEQWEVWDDNMLVRCRGDVNIQCDIYHALQREMGR